MADSRNEHEKEKIILQKEQEKKENFVLRKTTRNKFVIFWQLGLVLILSKKLCVCLFRYIAISTDLGKLREQEN